MNYNDLFDNHSGSDMVILLDTNDNYTNNDNIPTTWR